MTSDRPTRGNVAGRAYLDLRRQARGNGRATDEYLRLYALEGFLARLVAGDHADVFVVKGGVLLAAYAVRRPTADVDVASRSVPGEVESVRDLVASIAAGEADDGLDFDLGHISAERIRDEDQYAGVRVSLTARLATAVINFHVDINFGDPIWPAPQRVRLPRLLGGELLVLGYPPAMIFAEKLVTAIERATANTRWRDFADIYLLSRAHAVAGTDLVQAVHVVADHRDIQLRPLHIVLSGFADVAADRWTTWRDRQGLHALVPKDFVDVLTAVCEFADPALDDEVTGHIWDPASLRWLPGS